MSTGASDASGGTLTDSESVCGMSASRPSDDSTMSGTGWMIRGASVLAVTLLPSTGNDGLRSPEDAELITGCFAGCDDVSTAADPSVSPVYWLSGSRLPSVSSSSSVVSD